MPHSRPPATNVMPLPSIAPATPRPIRSSNTSSNSGTVNQTVCDLRPMLTAARNAPSTIIRPDADIRAAGKPSIAVGAWRLSRPRQHQARLRGQRECESGQVAHRPHCEIPEQRTRHGDRSRGEGDQVDRCAANRAVATPTRQVASSGRRHTRRRSRRVPPAATAGKALSPRSSTATHPCTAPAIAVAIFPRKM